MTPAATTFVQNGMQSTNVITVVEQSEKDKDFGIHLISDIEVRILFYIKEKRKNPSRNAVSCRPGISTNGLPCFNFEALTTTRISGFWSST